MEAGVRTPARVCIKERTSLRRQECCKDFLSLRKWFKGTVMDISSCYFDVIISTASLIMPHYQKVGLAELPYNLNFGLSLV